MRGLFVAALLLITAACGAYQFPGDTPSPSAEPARVTGTVMSVPCSPVEQKGVSCAGRPVPNLEIDYMRGSTVVAMTTTNSSGAYVVNLAPGTYDVAPKTYMRVISGPTRLSLTAGTKTVANYVLDNGIRVPVPEQ